LVVFGPRRSRGLDLPFGFLVMMAVFNRFDARFEEAARDMGADEWTVFKEVTLPLITPGIVAAGLFGFTLSYDEFARTTLLAGAQNTLPLDINASMTQRVQPTFLRSARPQRYSRC
jgi:putative spermidine/putrescine transport system permease protein